MKKSNLLLLPVFVLLLAVCYFSSCNNRPSGGGGGTTEAPPEAQRQRCDTLRLRQDCFVQVRDTVWGRRVSNNTCVKGWGICYGPVSEDQTNSIVVGVRDQTPIEGGGCPCP